jgi:predicted 3-demethylubiquinone-9 3-methyltransferase (glyoxalase superfamily)
MTKNKITPFLWFNGNAEEAANFYTSNFPNSKILETSHYGEGMPFPAGTVLVGNFSLDGNEIRALNGGPEFSFSEAISLQIDCANQEEIDYFWGKLTADGGEPGPCGWLKDKYGLSWQVVPENLGELIEGEDAAGSQRAGQALMQMGKLDIAKLREPYEGKGVPA